MFSKFKNSRFMLWLSAYLRKDIDVLDFDVSYLKTAIRSGIGIFLWWSVPAGLFVYGAREFKEYLPHAYFEAAISEGIGPRLWNVLGSLGLVLFGLLLLFPRSKFLGKSAHHVLSNTFAIGGLTFGLAMGRLIFGLANESINMEAWRLWLAGAGTFVLVVQVIFLKFSLWVMGCLAKPDQNGERTLLWNVQKVRLPLRFVVFSILAAVPTVALMLEK